jgi:hypothetical protein
VFLKYTAPLQGRILCTETTKIFCINVGSWTLHFRAVAHKVTWLKSAVFLFIGPSKSIVYATAINDAAELQQTA